MISLLGPIVKVFKLQTPKKSSFPSVSTLTLIPIGYETASRGISMVSVEGTRSDLLANDSSESILRGVPHA
jgi:hypothetical protein